jgi:ATP-dependent Clp protease ATP-binding subunit ClpC
MFERFTAETRRVIVLAQEEARALNHNSISSEHLLLGLLREDENLASRALVSLSFSLESVRDSVGQRVPATEHLSSGHIPFTPRAKRVLELANRESRQLGHDRIRPEHLLLGLLRDDGEGLNAVFADHKVQPHTIRSGVISLMVQADTPETETGVSMNDSVEEDEFTERDLAQRKVLQLSFQLSTEQLQDIAHMMRIMAKMRERGVTLYVKQ